MAILKALAGFAGVFNATYCPIFSAGPGLAAAWRLQPNGEKRSKSDDGATMRTLGIVIATVVAVVIVLVTWAIVQYRQTYPAYTHRYRLTVEVEVDGQVKSGSGVIQVTWEKQPKFGEAPPWRSTVKGQAVFVDLGTGGALLALPSGGGDGPSMPYGDRATRPEYIALRAFGRADLSVSGYPLSADALIALSSMRECVELQPNNLPRFVLLVDKADPASARFVRSDQLQALSGSNIRLYRVVIEITGDPVATDLATKLPWLKVIATGQKSKSTITQYGIFGLKSLNLSPGIDP